MKKFLLLIFFVIITSVPWSMAQSPPVTVVVLGSSTALGTGATPGNGWANLYKNYLLSLNPANEFYNFAQVGFSTGDILPGTWDGSISRALDYWVGADLIILNLSSGDARWNVPVAQQIDNYEEIISIATGQNIPIIITTPHPRNFDEAYPPDEIQGPGKRQNLIDARDAMIERFGNLVIDFWTGIADPDGRILPTYNAGDGIHLNDQGHALLFSRLVQGNVQGTGIGLTLNTGPPFCYGTNLSFTVNIPESSGITDLKYHVGQSQGVSINGTNFSYSSPGGNHGVLVRGKDAANNVITSNTVFITMSGSCPKDEGQVTVVVLGSSTAEGVGADQGHGWVWQFEEYLKSIHPGSIVYNLARSGYSTYQVLPDGYMNADPDRNITRALSLNPDVIIINLPSNDAASNYPVADQVARYNIILNAATAAGVPVYVTTTQPRDLSPLQRENLREMRDFTLVTFGSKAINFWDGIATSDGFILPEYDSGDGIHLNNYGHSLLANRVLNAGIIEPRITLSADVANLVVCPGAEMNFSVTYPTGSGIVSMEYIVNRGTAVSFSGSTFTYLSPTSNYRVYVTGKEASGNAFVSNIIYFTIDQSCVSWTGNTGTDWFTGSNWAGSTVPGSEVPVTIPAGAPNMPIVTYNNVVCKSLTINSNATLTIGGGGGLTVSENINNNGTLVLASKAGANGLASFLNNGPVTGRGVARIRLELQANRFFYLSSPVHGATFGNFNAGTPGSSVHVYRNSQWYSTGPAHAALPLLNLEGVTVKYSGNTTLEYTGVLNNGAISRTYTTAGWYLLGNPYPSFISWQNEAGWSRTNISSTIWYRTMYGGVMRFITYNRLAPPGARAAFYPVSIDVPGIEAELALIPPMQAVWVRAMAPATIVVNNEARGHGVVGSSIKSGNNGSMADIIRITASNGITRDGTVVYFSENSVDEIDRSDSEKRFNDSPEIPEIYSRVGTVPLAINGLAQLDSNSRLIPLSVTNRISNDVLLHFDMGLFYAEHSVNLEDKVTGNFVNLREQPSYTFTPTVLGEVHYRFVIHVNNLPTKVNINPGGGQDNSERITISVVDNGIAVVKISDNLLVNGRAMIEVYTIDGHLISKTATGAEVTEIFLPAFNRVHLVKVIAGGKVAAEKMITKR